MTLPSPSAEFLSSFVASAALNTLDVQGEALRATVWPFARRAFPSLPPLVDAMTAVVTMLFVNLVVIFGPTYGRLSRGATNNPVACAMRALAGRASGTRAAACAGASIAAHVASYAMLASAVKTWPKMFPGKTPMAPMYPSGGFARGVVAEAAVTSANFIFFGLAEKRLSSALLPALGSAFYVFTMLVEGCRYSCGFMNPSTVIASHVVSGNILSLDALQAIATYVVGALLGCVIVLIVMKLFMPKSRRAMRARATSRAAVRSISAARERSGTAGSVRRRSAAPASKK